LSSVGYVEFKNEESVALALQLTGQKLQGIPIIVQVTEAEKNRQARSSESGGGHPNQVPFHRLYVGNIHFNVNEEDLRAVFESFGELEFVQLQRDENGRSRGYGFVQYVFFFLIKTFSKANIWTGSAMLLKPVRLWRR
jgi:RNA-binding protein 39